MVIDFQLVLPDDFVPPDIFDGEHTSCGQCGCCPFFEWNDDYGEGWCNCSNPDPTAPDEACPIKPFYLAALEQKKGILINAKETE